MNKIILSFAFLFTLLSAQLAFGQTMVPLKQNAKLGSLDVRIENFDRQAAEMFESFKKKNFEKLADLTHPKLIERAGSKENFILIMKRVSQRATENLESTTFSLGKSSELIEIDGQLFSVISKKIETISTEKNKVVLEGFLVGISDDKGKNWKFVNGEQFNDLFPSATNRIKVPKEKTFINGVEQ